MDLTPETTRMMLGHGIEAVKWFVERYFPKADATASGEAKPGKGLLVIGPGGTGKTTFAKLISGQLATWASGNTWKYEESVAEESFALVDQPNVEVVVPAGQLSRRAVAWADVTADLASGRYSGVVFVAAYGYHTLSGPGYQLHPLYKSNKDEFLSDYTAAKRQEELAALEFILPALEAAPDKLWLLTLVTKQDLWWKERGEAEAFYMGGKWAEHVAKVRTTRGAKVFFPEFCPVSLTMSNLKDPEGNVLFPTTGGYDVERQIASMDRLFVAFDAVRKWEGET